MNMFTSINQPSGMTLNHHSLSNPVLQTFSARRLSHHEPQNLGWEASKEVCAETKSTDFWLTSVVSRFIHSICIGLLSLLLLDFRCFYKNNWVLGRVGPATFRSWSKPPTRTSRHFFWSLPIPWRYRKSTRENFRPSLALAPATRSVHTFSSARTWCPN